MQDTRRLLAFPLPGYPEEAYKGTDRIKGSGSMWREAEHVKHEVEEWLRKQNTADLSATGRQFSVLGTLRASKPPVSYFALLRNQIGPTPRLLARALPEPGFAVLVALAIAGPDQWWVKDQWPHLCQMVRDLAGKLNACSWSRKPARLKQDAALDFVVASLLTGLPSAGQQLVFHDLRASET